MNKKTVLFYVMAFIIGFLVGFLINKVAFTGQVIEEIPLDRTYTTAICNTENECIDIFVECSNGRVVKLEPVSKLIQFSDGWEDFREEEGYCK